MLCIAEAHLAGDAVEEEEELLANGIESHLACNRTEEEDLLSADG